MRAGMVAHNVPPPLGIDRSMRRVTNFQCAADHRADVYNQARNAFTRVRYFGRPHRHIHVFWEIVDLGGVTYLTTSCGIKGRCWEDKLDLWRRRCFQGALAWDN